MAQSEPFDYKSLKQMKADSIISQLAINFQNPFCLTAPTGGRSDRSNKNHCSSSAIHDTAYEMPQLLLGKGHECLRGY